MIFAGAALLAIVAPANAQYFAPFGGPGMLSAPEAASGTIAAAAAHGAAQQQQCVPRAVGRDGPRGMCIFGPDTPQPQRKTQR